MIEPYASGKGWTLYHGDALAVLPHLEPDTVDLVFTDPPYSSGGLMRSDRAANTGTKYQRGDVLARFEDFAGDNKDQRSHIHWSMIWLGECVRLLRPDRVAALWTDWRQLPATTDVIQGAGLVWRGIADWNKTAGARPRRGGFRQQSEYIVWGSNGRLRDDDDLPCLPGSWHRASNADPKEHVAAKPVPILLDVIALAKPCEVVLDPFSGSATTGEAAIVKGREFIGVEVTEYWAEVSARRLEAVESGASPTQLEQYRAGQRSMFADATVRSEQE